MYFVAPVNLPSGVEVRDIRLYYYDNHANSIALIFFRVNIDSLSVENLGSCGSTTPGYQNVGFDPDIKFDNKHPYSLEIAMPTNDSSLAFLGVRIKYRRMISPAPSTATFPDVPVGYTFHQHIEALAASGITTGFSDGTFKPKEYVTREQMAAFLARALGLHHPD